MTDRSAGDEDSQTADARAADLQYRAGLEFLSHRKWRALDGNPGETREATQLSVDLVRRVMVAYQNANREDCNDASMWTEYFNSKHRESHAALMRGDVATVMQIWQNPADNYAFWGFDELHQTYTEQRRGNELGKEMAGLRVYDNLLQLAMATGDIDLEYPEAQKVPFEKIETILRRLDRTLGFHIDFPNPYPFEYGLQTTRGVASYRAVQALYQGYKTRTLLAGRKNPTVLEIGPGLGRAAYYADKLGIRDYTLIDLPFSNVSQGLFLGTTLSEDIICLKGESNSGRLKILTPDSFLSGNRHYDLIVNFDSITEMDYNTQCAYMEKIRNCCDIFLSVNHEFNPRTVSSLISEKFSGFSATRDPSWMRRGYVQEVVRFDQHGRKWNAAGQCLRRTTLAFGQIRRRLFRKLTS